MTHRVLVVDDDPNLREVVRYALHRAGFDVIQAGDGAEALERIDRDAIDLVVLDILMPEVDGLELCRRIRRTSTLPIIFLSSKGDEFDRVLGLELGADDYLAKPFSPRELVSRARAVLRRTSAPREVPSDPSVTAGRVRLDPTAFRAWVDDRELGLTVTEFRLLLVLAGYAGRVFTRDELAERAYPDERFVSGRTVDSHVRRIRCKIRGAADPERTAPEPIHTVYGLGYRLEA